MFERYAEYGVFTIPEARALAEKIAADGGEFTEIDSEFFASLLDQANYTDEELIDLRHKRHQDPCKWAIERFNLRYNHGSN